ncbi:MAG: hypothetical protein IPJ77_23410 [Planctomycetes bacterium]|nr:hypothetical protein [Planctomycetota bacterium]
MEESPLEQFLSQDCTPFLRNEIESKLADPKRVYLELFSNRFNLVFDKESGTAVIDDDLDTSPAGRQVLPLKEFLEALSRRTAR